MCLEVFAELSTSTCHGIDAAHDFGILNQGRRVMGFDSGIDDQRASTAPMLVERCRVDAVNIYGRIAPRESDPDKVVYRSCGHVGIIDKDNHSEAI